MFGSTIAGRPITIAEQIDTLKYAIRYDGLSVKTAYHLSIFLLPNVEFDPTFTALIYYQFQIQPAQVGGMRNTAGPLISTEFRLLGGLGSDKQSAIFKINPGQLGPAPTSTPEPELENITEGDIDMESGLDEAKEMEQTASIILGISIEPNDVAIPQLEQQRAVNLGGTATVKAIAPPPPKEGEEMLETANKIIQSCYNYLSSFADANNMVSLNKFNDWWDKFKVKTASDRNYLTHIDG